MRETCIVYLMKKMKNNQPHHANFRCSTYVESIDRSPVEPLFFQHIYYYTVIESRLRNHFMLEDMNNIDE